MTPNKEESMGYKYWVIKIRVPKSWAKPSFKGSLEGFFNKLKLVSIVDSEG